MLDGQRGVDGQGARWVRSQVGRWGNKDWWGVAEGLRGQGGPVGRGIRWSGTSGGQQEEEGQGARGLAGGSTRADNTMG